MQNAAYELDMDPSELRLKNFIDKDQFPYESATGFVYDSGDYHGAMNLALRSRIRRAPEGAGGRPRRGQDRSGSRASPRSGAGPHKDYDILGVKMNDGAELRIHRPARRS